MLIFLASNKVSWLFSAVNVQLSTERENEERGRERERGEEREGEVLTSAASAYLPFPPLTCNSLPSASTAPTWYPSNALNQMFIFALAFPLLFLFLRSPSLSALSPSWLPAQFSCSSLFLVFVIFLIYFRAHRLCKFYYFHFDIFITASSLCLSFPFPFLLPSLLHSSLR